MCIRDRSGTDVTLRDVDALELGNITANSLTATGTDVNASTGSITTASGSTFVNSAGDATNVGAAADDADPATFELTDADLAAISGDIAVESGGGDIDVESAELAPNQSLCLDADGGTVDFSTGRTRIRGSGDLTVTNAASITDSAPITVGDIADFTSTGVVTLDQAGNNFLGSVNASGTDAVSYTHLTLPTKA